MVKSSILSNQVYTVLHTMYAPQCAPRELKNIRYSLFHNDLTNRTNSNTTG